MMRAGLALFALSLAAACTPPATEDQHAEAPSTVVVPPSGCTAQTAHDWSAVGSQYYVVEAEARGDTCADAVATIRIKSTEGAVLFTHDYPVAQVPLAFSPNGDQTTRRDEIEAWAANAADTPTADWLPSWPSGAQRPPGFQPASGITRQRYEQFRGNQGPIFCYPDGGESNACVAMSGQTATLLGSLTPESP